MVSSEVEFLEDRLALLETWLESTKYDDDNNEDLIQKQDEYKGLIEETVLLQKKLRKVSRLLSTETSKKMLQKLAKKHEQYLNEIEEIMNYAESDVLFETAEIEPNELLGEPLETLMEHPGMEGSSSSLNFSLSDFMPGVPKASKMLDELQPIAESNGHSSPAKYHESMESISIDLSGIFTARSANSNTSNYDVKTLRKKLRKVEKLLSTNEISNSNNEISTFDKLQIKKLRKKHEQYSEALQDKFSTRSSSSNGDDDRANESSIHDDENNAINHDAEQHQSQGYIKEDIEEKILEASEETIEEEIEEFDEEEYIEEDYIEEEYVEEEYEEVEIEEEEYGAKEDEVKKAEESNTEQYHDSLVSNVRDHDCLSNVVYDRKTLKKKLKKLKRMIAATSDDKELQLYKQKKKEYKLALKGLKEQEVDAEPLSQSRLSQHEEEVAPIEGSISPSHGGADSVSRRDKSTSKENKEQIEALKKKIRKAEKSISKARSEDDSKKVKKIEKRRLEYQTALLELTGHH